MGYKLDGAGIYVSQNRVVHRNDEFDEAQFQNLFEMQSKHFWYLGRHRFILESLRRFEKKSQFSAIDLGGGCGGWVKYLAEKLPQRISRLGLADSSRVALLNAKQVLPQHVDFYQVDLMDLGIKEQWDTGFLLDVIEHCPDDAAIVKEAVKSLKPGGKLFIATPALDFFWSYNDDFVKHIRRYDKEKYRALAGATGLKLIDSRYFMFLLSPLLWLSRKTKPDVLDEKEMARLYENEYKTPHAALNLPMHAVFSAETPLGHILPFPWGTSILGVFEKPL